MPVLWLGSQDLLCPVLQPRLASSHFAAGLHGARSREQNNLVPANNERGEGAAGPREGEAWT